MTRSETEIQTIRHSIKMAEEMLDELRRDLDVQLKRTTVICCSCGQIFPIRTLRYIQTHWYVKPYGCTGGDYYNEGEGQWDCPKCGRNNRLYDQPEIEELKRLFASVHECYCTQDHSMCADPTPCNACRKAGRTRDGSLPRSEGAA